jgi:pimeloyl-ACP methyl ester carboxylesterase
MIRRTTVMTRQRKECAAGTILPGTFKVAVGRNAVKSPAFRRRHLKDPTPEPYGRSSSPKDGKFSMDLFARALEAVRGEAKADKMVLVGHSMGTPVIRQYARLYPQHVAALVLVDGVVAISGGLAPQPAQMSGPGGLVARERFIRRMFTPATPPALQQQILKMMLAAPEATASGALLATLDPTNWKDDVMPLRIEAECRAKFLP